MGCWGFGILESDDALDWEAELLGKAGVSRGYDVDDGGPPADELPAMRAKLEAALPQLLAHLVPKNSADVEYEEAMGYQVLATLLMESGCAFSENVRSALIAGSTACPEYQFTHRFIKKFDADYKDEHLKEAFGPEADVGFRGYAGLRARFQGRRAAIDGLVELLKGYDIAGGAPAPVKSKGLLETIFLRDAAETLH